MHIQRSKKQKTKINYFYFYGLGQRYDILFERRCYWDHAIILGIEREEPLDVKKSEAETGKGGGHAYKAYEVYRPVIKTIRKTQTEYHWETAIYSLKCECNK